ncbi:MAG: hypothetical protein ACP5T0_08190 [Verrucomicrobiia bacterium]
MKHYSIKCRVALALLMLVLQSGFVFGQQQFQGLCTRIKIEILQELTIERIGFEATLEVVNNDGEDPITDFSASLTFERPATATAPGLADASSLFFVRAPELENINDINGAGIIGPTRKAVVKWFIIPKPSAGGTNANGVVYRVGCNLSGKIRGAPIPSDVLFAIPDTITVKPEPLLEITYFQPRDVQGDDPFTPEIESPIPFTLGVIVKNAGYGMARSVKINSQQPKIVENKQSLLLIAQLLGARVQDSPRSASLLVNLGDIPPGDARKGAWDMITSLSGEFVEFKASYTHASELGGEETSIIKSLQAHFILHEVLVDLPGRDNIKDFLADTDRDENMLPDAIYENNGNILPVNTLTNFTLAGEAGAGATLTLNLNAEIAGWGYMRANDPAQGKLPIASIVRSDGKILNTNNYWRNTRYTKVNNVRLDFLNILDLVDLGNYSYTITYGSTGNDTTPPSTMIKFAGPVYESDNKYYVTPETQIYFISEDQSPVSMYYSITNSPFIPALPFKLRNPGEYLIKYYAIDTSQNRESDKTAVVVVGATGDLNFADIQQPSKSLVISGDAVSLRPGKASILFSASPNPAPVNANVEIFSGVIGFLTVSNLPSSPTRSTEWTFYIGGDYVDYYKYRLDGGGWSVELPAQAQLVLTNLAQGGHSLYLLGRARQGDYQPESNAVVVSWIVDSGAPVTKLSGNITTPSRSATAQLAVSGASIDKYRWTINSGYYRAETDIGQPIVLTDLVSGQNTVAAIGRINGEWQPTNSPTTISWVVNPLYGYDLSLLERTRTFSYTNIGSGLIAFEWDGKKDNNLTAPPGWYTARITLYDGLGRTNFITRLIQIEEFTGETKETVASERMPGRAFARGGWIVWEDQSDGSWQIYALDLNGVNQQPVRVSEGTLNQQNPKTDGRYVVWQGRLPNGSFDIYFKNLVLSEPPRRLTSTPDVDEINPAIDWPWVVYQEKNILTPGAPYQLRAVNLLSGQYFTVAPSTQDELDPDVHTGQVVWQDFRDPGYGEIYYKNLETGNLIRITTNIFGQYKPTIYNNWIVWQDNRNGEVDIYGYDLLRGKEIRLTETSEDEARPRIEGEWVVCEEYSFGIENSNLRLIHAPSRRVIPVTRTISKKSSPSIGNGVVAWSESQNNLSVVKTAKLPSLQAVFENQNAVVVTETIANLASNAFTLLSMWHSAANIDEITVYTSLLPQVETKRVRWINGAPSGDNFDLTAGMWLWLRFDSKAVLDLGANDATSINLPAGVNALSYAGFPNNYSAYKLLQQLGLQNARAVRMLNSDSGQWLVARVVNNAISGNDFTIPNAAVLLIEMANPVSNFKPQ